MITLLRRDFAASFLLGAVLVAVPNYGNAAAPDPKSAAKASPAFRVVAEAPIPQSTFIIPSQPSEGRNPFFPQSIVRVAPKSVPPTGAFDASSFILNGITSPPRRTAMINGRTFEPGEEGEVRLPSGARTLIKCEEIRSDSAIINVGGQRREVRMRSGL